MLLHCPLPITTTDRVLLGHGSGGKLSAELMRDVFLPEFSNPILDRLDDQAQCEIGAMRVAITTDSFVVQPLFFPGGNIGSLAVHGTVNDLAMAGARPLYLSAAYIVEEGFPMDDLRRIASSMGRAAREAGVAIVAGDTKVVQRGAADGVFINTTGFGLIPDHVRICASAARPGDAILLSGTLGDHGIAVMAAREDLRFDTVLESDSAALHTLVDVMLQASPAIRCLRDPTRGGLSSTLNELAAQSGVGMRILESAIPVRPEVQGACEMLGLDALYVANEGKLVAVVAAEAADRILAAMRAHPLGRDAALIGSVTADHPGCVVLRTAFGTTRVVDMLAGGQLPRIC